MKLKLLFLFLLSFSALSFSQTTYIPDDNFEQVLINAGIDDVLDDYVLTANINTFTSFGVSGQGITDLTGIGGFTALTYLSFSNNPITTVDLSNNVNLEILNCFNTQLTSLDLSQNIALSRFRCYASQLSGTLDLSNNTLLTQVECSQNQLTGLILPQSNTLRELRCNNNQIMSLDTSQNPNLYYLNCQFNSITSLDMSQNPILGLVYAGVNELTSLITPNSSSLWFLTCDANQLTSLDMSHNSGLIQFACTSNPLLESLNLKNGNNTMLNAILVNNTPSLTCIEVDDANYSNTNWTTNIDPQHYFSEDCSNLSVSEFDASAISVYPNPVLNAINVRLQHRATFSVFDINGKLVSTGSVDALDNKVNVASLRSGLYFLKLVTGTRTVVKKIIKT